LTEPQPFHVHIRPHLSSAKDWGVVLSILLFFSWFILALSPAVCPGSDSQNQSAERGGETLQTRIFEQASYLTTRREAIVTYVKALQAPEGYFHAWLAAPPPFDPDGTSADYTVVQDAYDTLKSINRTSAVVWTSTKEFISSLIHGGLLNLSKSAGVSTGTCQDALTFIPEIGLGALIDVDANVQYVLSLQQTDGGFLFDDTSSKSTLVGTYFALDTLRLAGKLYMADIQKAKAFLASCYNESGWYSDSSGGPENIFVTAAGIMSAEMLGVLDEESKNNIAEYLIANWDATVGADMTKDLYVTERIAWSLELLGCKDLIDSNKLCQWVLNLQKNMNGAFVSYPNSDIDQERLVFAKYATHILSMYNGTDLLDEEFSVVTPPIWTIPQWWIDYINSEWSTTTAQGWWPGFQFPDLSIIINNLPLILLVLAASTPAIFIVHRSRVKQERRRQLKRERKNRHRGP
jgi:prenyltransferase beta subunit